MYSLTNDQPGQQLLFNHHCNRLHKPTGNLFPVNTEHFDPYKGYLKAACREHRKPAWMQQASIAAIFPCECHFLQGIKQVFSLLTGWSRFSCF
jgi:hypothetical protein